MMLLCRCDCSYFEDEPAIQSCYSQVFPHTLSDSVQWPSTATFWQSHRHIFPEDPVVKLSETNVEIKHVVLLGPLVKLDLGKRLYKVY